MPSSHRWNSATIPHCVDTPLLSAPALLPVAVMKPKDRVFAPPCVWQRPAESAPNYASLPGTIVGTNWLPARFLVFAKKELHVWKWRRSTTSISRHPTDQISTTPPVWRSSCGCRCAKKWAFMFRRALAEGGLLLQLPRKRLRTNAWKGCVVWPSSRQICRLPHWLWLPRETKQHFWPRFQLIYFPVPAPPVLPD